MPRSTHIGPYRILRLINQGGQGTVYLGFDDRLHRRVAIKIYRLPRDKLERRGLLCEAQLVASIQSSKVVQIYDLIVASDHVALIMEYVPGCDLEEFLTNGQPCLASIVSICIDVAGALAAARQQGIVHGDLKASNILITEQGRIKLTDFGIARGEGTLDLHKTSASLSCVSPEQYRGEALDVRSDLFALGCLLYRLLTRKQAFIHSGELDSESLLTGSPPSMEELTPTSLIVPAELSELLAALLQKAPDDRPGNTHEVRNILRAISRDIPLCVGNTLLHEARMFFRKESVEDVPPLIPGDLTRNGRSNMQGNRFGFWPDMPAGRQALTMVLVALIGFGLLGSVLVQAFFTEKIYLRIEVPRFHVDTAAEFPKEISSRWLVGEIEKAVGDQRTKVSVAGGLAAKTNKTFYSRGLDTGPDNDRESAPLRILSELRCIDQLCLLVLAIEKEGLRLTGQEAIFASMPISQWNEAVRSLTLALLKQSK